MMQCKVDDHWSVACTDNTHFCDDPKTDEVRVGQGDLVLGA